MCDVDVKELLLTCSLSTDPLTLWDYKTMNMVKMYKDGGTIAAKSLEILGQDYVIGAEFGKPILHFWPLNNQESKITRLITPGVVTCLTVCPRGLYLAAGIDCKVYVWHVACGKLLSVHQKNYQPISAIRFSNDGDYLLVGGEDGILTVYSFAELINLTNNFLTRTDIGQVEPIYIKHDHSMPVTDVHVGSFGRKSRFATVSTDQTCRVYNLMNGEPLLTLIFNDILSAVTFDAPCWQLFVGNNSGNIYQLTLKNSGTNFYQHVDDNHKASFGGHKARISCIVINITNTRLASGSDDGMVYIWEIRSRQILKKIEHANPVTNIKFVLGYQHFFLEKFKHKAILKKIERKTDISNTKLSISKIQGNDINIDKTNYCLYNVHFLSTLMQENKKLRCVNKQLYNIALDISKKYNHSTQA